MTDAAESDSEAVTEPDMAAPPNDPVKIPKSPSIIEAEALVAHAKSLPKDGELVLDAQDVAEMNTAYLLATISTARSFADAGGKVAVIKPSAAFVDAFSDLGLFQDLMKMEFRQ
ncbi:MAG: hypothetical protein AAFR17_04675 [Pseudomonadota bacterium]